jgi:hypothetical protein
MKDIPALTGRLSIKYSTPIRTGTVVKLEAKIVKKSHRIFFLEGKALVEGKKVASAEARYMLSDEFNHFPERIPGIEDAPSRLVKNHSFEHKLIGDIVEEYPETSEVMKKYFGKDCLQRTSFKIKTLEIACILFGVDQNRLIQEFEKIQN